MEDAREQRQGEESERNKLRSAVAAWEAAHDEDDPGPYRIGPRDDLEITVYGLESPGSPTSIVRTVTASGEIKLPWIGAVPVSGLTPVEVEEHIRNAYAGKYLKKPRVTVRMTRLLSKQVIVTGAVKNPGVYAIEGSRSSLLELLFRAGGLGEEAGDDVLVLAPRRGAQGAGSDAQASRVLSIDLNRLLGQGDMALNVELRPGYVVTVPPSMEGYYVLGYVRSPGNYRFQTTHRITVLHAIARAGGPSGDGRAENGFLVREGTDGRNVVVPVNLEKIVSGEVPAPYLNPGDGFILGTNFWAQAGHFLSGGANVTANASVSPQ